MAKPPELVDPDAPTAQERRLVPDAPFALSPVELAAGARVDDYEIEARRGAGGFATVYRARDTRSGDAVALKVLHAELARAPNILRRFQREAEIIARLDHPAIVRLRAVGHVDGVPYLAMDWIEGATLAEVLREHGAFSLDEALPILETLAGALGAAHALGVVHRDLKAANVALAGGDARLLDFGIAKLLDRDGASGFTTVGTKVGTPHYMAPEQVLGKATIDARADIYAFAILVFEMLTGRRPFDGPSLVDIEERQLHEPPPPLTRFVAAPPALDDVIRHAMEKDPAARYPSIAAMMIDLRAAAAGAEVPARRRHRESAVALHVHAAVVRDDADDDAFDLLDRALDDLRAQTTAAGLEVVVEMATSLLLLARPALAAQRALIERIEAIARAVAQRAQHPDLRIAVTLHVGTVDVVDGACVGGPLLDVADWTRQDDPGVHLTPVARSVA